MYYAMDEIGRDTLSQIQAKTSYAEKWRLIDELAQKAGFSGIHLSKYRYEREFRLPLSTLPEELQRYRLTYHLELPGSLLTEDEWKHAWYELDGALSFAKSAGMEDVSIDPPVIPSGMRPMRGYLRERFFELLAAISREYRWAGVTLSVRSDISGRTVMQGLADYTDFINGLQRIGALVDLSTVYFQGYSENDLLAALDRLPVTGFYVSDAFPGRPMAAGTRLPVGDGLMGLERILARFAKRDKVFGALSIDASFEEIKASLQRIMAFRYAG